MSQPSTDNTLSTLDQRRAADAFARIEAIRQDRERANHYATEARKLPVRIMASGLGQALAFLFAKKESKGARGDAIKQLLVDLGRWVQPRLNLSANDASIQPDSLIRHIIAGDADLLRRATDETLAYLRWLNRFAEAHGLTKDE